MKPTISDLETAIIDAMAHNDWDRVAELEPQLDALSQPKHHELLPSALWYASVGLHVFPLQPRLKMPYRGTRGLKEATTDPEVIKTWWGFKPDSNIGIATGHLVDVIDIDGPKGVKSWATSSHLPMRPDPNSERDPRWDDVLGVVSTPRPGGTHLYIKATGVGNKAGIEPGIDIRGLGGYVVAPPSLNEEGTAYTWRQPLRLE